MAASPVKVIVPTIKQLGDLGASEVLCRVCEYNSGVGARGTQDHHVPTKWQAIVKHVNATLPWAVAVRADPDEADRDARLLFVSMNEKPHKKAALAKARANPPPAPAAAPVEDEDDGLDLI